jgi:hypothetical protein
LRVPRRVVQKEKKKGKKGKKKWSTWLISH